MLEYGKTPFSDIKDLKILKLSDVFHLKLLTFVYESIHYINMAKAL